MDYDQITALISNLNSELFGYKDRVIEVRDAIFNSNLSDVRQIMLSILFTTKLIEGIE